MFLKRALDYFNGALKACFKSSGIFIPKFLFFP